MIKPINLYSAYSVQCKNKQRIELDLTVLATVHLVFCSTHYQFFFFNFIF